MEVELRSHEGRNVITGETQTLPQYQVFVDNRRVGFMGWGVGSRICFVQKVGPVERKDIELKVATLLESVRCESGPVQSSVVPDVPDEVLNPSKEDSSFDDFD